jgi:hypothetical protein
MAIPPTPSSPYPDVPIAPGVPAVLRAAGAAVTLAAPLLTADGPGVLQQFVPPQWGIYFSTGAPAVVADSVFDVEFRQEYRIAQAPQEQGAFTSYNKVQVPFDARVTFAQGDDQASRSQFLQQILQAAASLDLLNLVTPEITYTGVNIVHHGYRRAAASGATLLLVDVWVEQVRVTGTTQFSSSNTGGASGSDPQNIGAVTPMPTAAQPEAVGGLS